MAAGAEEARQKRRGGAFWRSGPWTASAVYCSSCAATFSKMRTAAVQCVEGALYYEASRGSGGAGPGRGEGVGRRERRRRRRGLTTKARQQGLPTPAVDKGLEGDAGVHLFCSRSRCCSIERRGALQRAAEKERKKKTKEQGEKEKNTAAVNILQRTTSACFLQQHRCHPFRSPLPRLTRRTHTHTHTQYCGFQAGRRLAACGRRLPCLGSASAGCSAVCPCSAQHQRAT